MRPRDRAAREPERRGDLVVAAPVEGRAHHHLALEVGERGEARQRIAGGHSLLDELLHARRSGDGHQALGQLAARAQRGDRDVVDDPVQPGASVPYLSAAAEGTPGLEESLLEDVLGRRATRRHAPAVGKQLAAVPANERFEGALVPVAGERHQPLVGLRLEKTE